VNASGAVAERSSSRGSAAGVPGSPDGVDAPGGSVGGSAGGWAGRSPGPLGVPGSAESGALVIVMVAVPSPIEPSEGFDSVTEN
jgi:hypothetical protein